MQVIEWYVFLFILSIARNLFLDYILWRYLDVRSNAWKDVELHSFRPKKPRLENIVLSICVFERRLSFYCLLLCYRVLCCNRVCGEIIVNCRREGETQCSLCSSHPLSLSFAARCRSLPCSFSWIYLLADSGSATIAVRILWMKQFGDWVR